MATEKSFSERWAGKFVSARRGDARYDALARKYLERQGSGLDDKILPKKIGSPNAPTPNPKYLVGERTFRV